MQLLRHVTRNIKTLILKLPFSFLYASIYCLLHALLFDLITSIFISSPLTSASLIFSHLVSFLLRQMLPSLVSSNVSSSSFLSLVTSCSFPLSLLVRSFLDLLPPFLIFRFSPITFLVTSQRWSLIVSSLLFSNCLVCASVFVSKLNRNWRTDIIGRLWLLFANELCRISKFKIIGTFIP